MLESFSATKDHEVIYEPVDMEVPAVDAGDRTSALVIRSGMKIVSGKPIGSMVHRKQESALPGLNSDALLREVNSLLNLRNKYSNSSVFFGKLTGLLQLCGRSLEALEYAKKASDIDNDPVYLIKLAEALHNAGHTSAAIDIYKSLGENNNTEALLRLAEFAINDNDFSHAKEIVDKATASVDSDWRVFLLSGTLHLAGGNISNAINDFRTALNDRNNSSVLYFNLAISFHLAGLTKKALTEAKKALFINPMNRSALALFVDISLEDNKQLDQAEKYLKFFLKISPADKPFIERLANVYFSENKALDGIDLLSKLKNNRDDPILWNNLGALWAKQKRKDAAIYFVRAIDAAGGISNAHTNGAASYAVLNLAISLLERKEAITAERVLSEFMNSSPSTYLEDKVLSLIPALYVKSLAIQGKQSEAAKYALHTIRHPSIHNDAISELDAYLSAYNLLVTADYDRAIEHASHCVEILLNNPETAEFRKNIALNNLAVSLIEGDRLEQARPIVRKLKTNLKLSEFAIATKGLYALRVNRLEQGSILYEQAIAKSPEHQKKNALKQKMNLEIGRYYLRNNQYKDAVKYLNKAASSKETGDMYFKNIAIKKEAHELLDIALSKLSQ